MKKITLLAGEGALPLHVYTGCIQKGITCNIIGLKGHISTELFQGITYDVYPVYAISYIIKKLRELNTQHITLAGKVSRRHIAKLIIDPKGIQLLAMITRHGMRDNDVLSTIIQFLEKEGFCVIPPEKIATNLIVQKGNLTQAVEIHKSTQREIFDSVEILQGIAKYDVGQAIVVQTGLVLGIEAAEGTDELIKRCGQLRQVDEKGPILVKISKPHQDKRIDLPCIGPNTIEMLHNNGFQGVALEAENSLILLPEITIPKANNYGLFIQGV